MNRWMRRSQDEAQPITAHVPSLQGFFTLHHITTSAATTSTLFSSPIPARQPPCLADADERGDNGSGRGRGRGRRQWSRARWTRTRSAAVTDEGGGSG
uniref:Uncharacterized protein n=1 Tax=Oryza barthii TaxID=65489 RepID=A0A0D3EN90_9ORYZ